ncbi:hypothetical protein EVAR_9906_1 [Eumeta japonica]|uniref:Uncharacterized protein n=1 Tax=Eumeta variegata TaxID=151549 RepID=A0A4C1TQD9_EUMVA|nr:hypothetical protein EVAR_9906_1 [Eumeta japonica]
MNPKLKKEADHNAPKSYRFVHEDAQLVLVTPEKFHTVPRAIPPLRWHENNCPVRSRDGKNGDRRSFTAHAPRGGSPALLTPPTAYNHASR